MMRLGLFGGTFDPIHRGHLDVAHAARHALGLSQVWLVPARVPPHRRPPTASAAHRFAMAALACADAPALLLSDLEMDGDSPSYTEATLDRLPALGIDVRSIFLVTGADAFRDIQTWMGFPGILDRCHFVAVSRPGRSAPELRELLPGLATRMIDAGQGLPATPSVILVDAPTAPVSSTEIRRRLQEGGGIDDLVAPGVAAYIEKHGLYKDSSKDDA
jgi:nicotinate-nucleotide adenylyltransferase